MGAQHGLRLVTGPYVILEKNEPYIHGFTTESSNCCARESVGPDGAPE